MQPDRLLGSPRALKEGSAGAHRSLHRLCDFIQAQVFGLWLVPGPGCGWNAPWAGGSSMPGDPDGEVPAEGTTAAAAKEDAWVKGAVESAAAEAKGEQDAEVKDTTRDGSWRLPPPRINIMALAIYCSAG